MASRDDTGCPRFLSKEGTHAGGNRQHEPSLRGRDSCRASANPGALRHSPGSITHGSVARRASRREGELRESDGREIGRRRGSQRAWLLARAVMKPEANVMARRKSGQHGRTRTEAAASRGGGSRAPAGVPVRRNTYGRSWMFGSRPHRSVTPKLAARQPVRRGQGLASWEHLARIKSEREPRLAKRDLRRTREA